MTTVHDREIGILVVGSELLRGSRIDTNSAWLGHQLMTLGFNVPIRIVIGDDRRAIVKALNLLMNEVNTAIITGGLGPTHDDLTREAVSDWLGYALIEHEETRKRIEQLYQIRGRTPPSDVFRMARVIEHARVLPNSVGVAPGQWIEAGIHTLILLPGPPAELQQVFKDHVRPRLIEAVGAHSVRFHRFRTAGLPESEVAQRLKPMMETHRDINFSILPSPAQVDVEIIYSVPSGKISDANWHEILTQIKQALGSAFFGEGDETLESVVGKHLRQRAHTLATAESCTGGLLGHRITAVPGSSGYFMGGLIVYSNEAKIESLKVDADLIQTHGAVSEPVARAMAENVRRIFGTTWGIGITGIAGPTGGTPDKPVGTVHIAVAGPTETDHHQFRFHGNRDQIKWQSTQLALDMLRRHLHP